MKDNSKLGSSDSLIAAVRSIMEKEHTVPKGDKEKKLAALAHPKDKITHKDVLVGRGVLKKENSGERMGVIVGTRKEKVELEPKLKESNDHKEVKRSMEHIHADLIKHVPVGHHYWMDIHHSEGPLSHKDHEDHKQAARSDGVKIKVSQHRDHDNHHHVLIHSPHKEDVKAAADHLYDDKSVMKKGKDDDDDYAKSAARAAAKSVKEQVDERKLTGAETDKKEKYVMSLKKKMGGFKKRYGERAKEVMYATATKMAKNEETGQIDEIDNAPSSGDYSRYNSPEAQERRKKEREELAKQAHSTPKRAKIASKLGIKKEETVPVQEISTGLASRYLKKTDPETSSPKEVEKRKTGRALALTKKWGGRVSGTSAPKVPTKD